MYGIKKSGPRNPFFRLACILAACFTMAAAGNSVSDNKVQGIYQGQADQRNGLTYDNQQINGNGLEQKLGSAKDKSGTGAALAAATGASMISAGTPMVPSIITEVSVAGADLIAKGTLELVQAVADGAAHNQNGSGENTLRAPVDGNSPTAGGNIQLPQDLQNLLAQHGVNPDAFAQAAAAGQIQNANDVLKALGMPQASPEDLAKGQQIASSTLTNTMGRASPGTPLSQMTTMDESAKGGKLAAGGDDGGASGTLSENTNGTGLGSQSGVGAGIGAAGAGPGAASGSAAGKTAADGAIGGNGDGAAGGLPGLKGLMAGLGGAGAPAAKAEPTRAQLLAIGLLPKQPKQNLFQIAHRNYRSFQKWRQLRRVAQK